MKAISAALIVFSGAITFSAGIMTNNQVGQILGLIVGIVGLVPWSKEMLKQDPPA